MNESYFYLLRFLRGCSSRFINCKNGTKSRKASYIEISQLICSANLSTDFYINIGRYWVKLSYQRYRDKGFGDEHPRRQLHVQS